MTDSIEPSQSASKSQSVPTGQSDEGTKGAGPTKVVTASYVSAEFSGPLPPPAMLAQYDQISAGLADRIVAMAENQQSHRMKLESDAVSSQLRQSSIGQWFAFVLGLVGIGLGAAIILEGHVITGSLFTSGTLISLVTAFIQGKSEMRRSLAEKAKSHDAPRDTPKGGSQGSRPSSKKRAR